MLSRVETILNGIARTRRVAHAYLFAGPPGSGKFEAALAFAKNLNGGSEASCRRIKKNVHPDVIIIEKDGASLKIEQIRNLKELVRYGPSEAEYLIIIVKDADALTVEAANSFLKCLEEPPAQTVFILINEKEGSLPATIRSRCQRILFPENKDFTASDEANKFHESIMNSKSTVDLLKLSKTYEADEFLFTPLLFLFYKTNPADPRNLQSVRIIAEITNEIKRKVNKKLAMDMLLLRLGDIWNKN